MSKFIGFSNFTVKLRTNTTAISVQADDYKVGRAGELRFYGPPGPDLITYAPDTWDWVRREMKE